MMTQQERIRRFINRNGYLPFTACEVTRKLFPKANRYKSATVLTALHRLHKKGLLTRGQKLSKRSRSGYAWIFSGNKPE